MKRTREIRDWGKDWGALLLAALAPPISVAAVALLSRSYRQRRQQERVLVEPPPAVHG